MKERLGIVLSVPEAATILVALRHFQARAEYDDLVERYREAFSHVEPLSRRQIEKLCKKIREAKRV